MFDTAVIVPAHPGSASASKEMEIRAFISYSSKAGDDGVGVPAGEENRLSPTVCA